MWGGSERLYATVKFVLYTVVGSMLMLAAPMLVLFVLAEVIAHFTDRLRARRRGIDLSELSDDEISPL